MAGIAREVLPANGKRALNEFLTEYNWDEQQFNHERLDELQEHSETRWSKGGYIILDDTITQKAGDEVPGIGHFYDHAENDTVWDQDLVYAFYANDKTAYPLTFRFDEQQGDQNDDHDTKYDLVREIVTELEEEVGVRRYTYLFDSWFAHDSGLPEHIESYDKDSVPHKASPVSPA